MVDIRPGTDDLQRLARLIVHDFEGVLDPDIVPVAVAEPVFERPSAHFNELAHLLKDPICILGMQAARPELRIFKHLPRREAHDRVDVLADERAGVIVRGLRRIDDPRRDGQQILDALASCSARWCGPRRAFRTQLVPAGAPIPRVCAVANRS